MTYKVRYSRKVYIGRYETFDMELTREFPDNWDIGSAMNETQDMVEIWCKSDRIPPHSVFYRRDQKMSSRGLTVKEIDDANKAKKQALK